MDATPSTPQTPQATPGTTQAMPGTPPPSFPTKAAFRMFLLPGREAEYQRRHDELWPELAALLRRGGIADYSIYLDRATGTLFAVQRRAADFDARALSRDPVMQAWWRHMAPLMRTNEDGSPVVEPLPCVFHLD